MDVAGESFQSKLTRVRAEMAKLSATVFIVSALDEIAWLFNIRGSDIPCSPFVKSYAAVEQHRLVSVYMHTYNSQSCAVC